MIIVGYRMGYIGLDAVPILLKQSSNISLIHYGGALYEIVFHRGSHEAVDEWLEEVAAINATYAPTDTVCYIVNTEQTHEYIPILYVFRRSQEYVKAHPVRPITRTLIFHQQVDNNALLSILNIFSSWLSSHQQESALFLPINQQEKGIAWLLRDYNFRFIFVS